MEEVRFDWDWNCDIVTFEIEVPDSYRSISVEAEAVQERDGHADFELLSQMDVALGELHRQRDKLASYLATSYPELRSHVS